MKYIVLLGDGMADYPLSQLGGKTPLEYAHTPNMDRIAAEGTVGLIDTIPAGFTPGSDVANLSVLGYDPKIYHTGRAPLEAANMGVDLADDDVAFRCNLVTIGLIGGKTVIEDFTSGHISSEESRQIIDTLQSELSSPLVDFYPGVGYRHLMVYKKGPVSLETTPPHDIVGEPIDGWLPRGGGSDIIRDLMERSRHILKDHPVNLARASKGKKTADSIWLWGEGRAPRMEPLTARYGGIRGGVISAVDLVMGIGVYAGLETLRVEGATGYTDTNYRGKAQRALDYLRDGDFVFLHVEAPDEMGHEGNIEGKIKAIEDFDREVVGTILSGVDTLGDSRIMVLSDHPTPIILKTHATDPSPFAVLSSVDGENIANGDVYNETTTRNTGIIVSPGHLLMDYFMGDWGGLC
ncbi:MAG TPA: cofactor-independent phosphoglycerate mutase [Syntrophales bacterium]|nr:cofactor-independent phosphoglycerate mutase [Syntrophales bacterium]HPQ45324.1 cofactor-independent phosphoglycerate mutase [Syntrophales bacterium]